ncbi:uncharacterized protein EV420DRAFT_565159 [Desarmillaria tabescens]|uniref:Uncharacterized protein n=1 Tax=Armillaria tabescens TaxID=1929756 RepID=A0AA39K6B1_ARMTA|nr:uncharacterized protein EV420DRAFT_565159 [Desarmillaria tabescens]KAK0455369.1 hypothetical protein EV420DRAFT_565159 [Desarmillaria tabescens]
MSTVSTHIKSPPHKLRSISCDDDFSIIFHPFFLRLEAFESPSSWLQTDPLFAKIGHFIAELWQDLCFGRGWRAYSRYLGFGWVLPYILVSIICYHLTVQSISFSLFDRFPSFLGRSKALVNTFQTTPAQPHGVSPCSGSVTITIDRLVT